MIIIFMFVNKIWRILATNFECLLLTFCIDMELQAQKMPLHFTWPLGLYSYGCVPS